MFDQILDVLVIIQVFELVCFDCVDFVVVVMDCNVIEIWLVLYKMCFVYMFRNF